MKKRLLTLMLVTTLTLTMFTACGGNNTDSSSNTDSETEEQNKLPESKEITVIKGVELNYFGGETYRLDYEYDEYGNRVHSKLSYKDKTISETLYEYDEYNRVTKISKVFSEAGEYIESGLEYEYDEHGNVIIKRKYEPGYDTKQTNYTNEYDKAGNLIRRHTKTLEWVYEYEQVDNVKKVDVKQYKLGSDEKELKSWLINEYDENGNIISCTYYDKNGEQTNRWVGEYDSYGNLLDKDKYISEDKISREYETITIKVREQVPNVNAYYTEKEFSN